MSEQDPLLAPTTVLPDSVADPEATIVSGVSTSEQPSWRARTAKLLESQFLHRTIITLIIIDSACVLADLGYTLLTCDQPCSSSSAVLRCHGAGKRGRFGGPEEWLGILSDISLVITTLFVVEIPLQLWAFGIGHFSPFGWGGGSGGTSYGGGDGFGGDEDERAIMSETAERRMKMRYGALHLFDAAVVITTFILEVVLTGNERELAGLLVLLRLWRLVKLVGGVAAGAGEIGEENAQELADTWRELEVTKRALDEALAKNRVLRNRLGSLVSDNELAALDT